MGNRRALEAWLSLAICAAGCAVSRLHSASEGDGDSDSDEAGELALGAPGHFRRASGEGDVQVIWSIAPEDHPPSIEGASEVVRSAVTSELLAHVGRVLLGQPAVYAGTLEVTGGKVAPLPHGRVVATLEHTRNAFRADGPAYKLLHALRVYSPEHEQRVLLSQEGVLAAAPPAARLVEDGRGAAQVTLGIAADGTLGASTSGDCYACMTLLGDPGDEVPVIAIAASELDTAADPDFKIEIEGRLQRIAPEDLEPSLMSEAARARSASLAEATSAVLDGFREVKPGRFEREHRSTARVRCTEGGSRVLELRTTWRLQQGNVALSGMGDIEVVRALPCEPIVIGGGS